MEYHPRISSLNPQLSEKKIILGSFPTWALTPPDPDKNETFEEKEELRKQNNDLPFFYGSSTNRFWIWYSEFVDNTISKESIVEIQRSLLENAIGITDVIFQCKRKEKSALDKHLTNRVYNHSFFQMPGKGEVVKILCTSKGVMNEMFLNKVFFSKYSGLRVDQTESDQFQIEVLTKAGGSKELPRYPFYRSITWNEGGKIECFSIPSPGSPYRKLGEFGFTEGDLKQYLYRYLNEVFIWFKS